MTAPNWGVSYAVVASWRQGGPKSSSMRRFARSWTLIAGRSLEIIIRISVIGFRLNFVGITGNGSLGLCIYCNWYFLMMAVSKTRVYFAVSQGDVSGSW